MNTLIKKKNRPWPPCCKKMKLLDEGNVDAPGGHESRLLKCSSCGSRWFMNTTSAESCDSILTKENYWQISDREAFEISEGIKIPALSIRHHYYIDSWGNECMILDRTTTCSVKEYSRAINKKLYFYFSWGDILTGAVFLALGIFLFNLFIPPFAEMANKISSSPGWFYILKTILKAALPLVLFYSAFNYITHGIFISREPVNWAMIHEWADRGMNIEFMEFTKKTKKKFINMKDEDLCTPLHYAAERNNIVLVEYLLKHGAKTDLQNRGGMTPLIAAAERGHFDIVKALAEDGASIDIKTGTRSYHNSGWKNIKTLNAADIAKYNGHENIYFYLRNKQREEEDKN